MTQLYELAMDIQAKALFTNLMAGNPNDPRIPCPGGQVSYIASVAKCNAFCYYEDTQNAKMIAIPRICTDGCCVIEHKLCWDATTQSIVETRTVTSQGSSSACSGSSSSCPASIIRANANGIGTHTVLLDSVSDCIPSTECE